MLDKAKSSMYENFLITDLLFCSERSKEDEEKYRFSQGKYDKQRSYIYHKNIFTTKGLESTSRSLRDRFLNIRRSNVVFWANNTSSKFADKMAKFLIMNINNSLIFLLLNNLECVNTIVK